MSDDEHPLTISGYHEMFMVTHRRDDEHELVLIREAEVPAPPTWLTRQLSARGIYTYDVKTLCKDGIWYYSPMVPHWVAAVYKVAKCRLQKPVISSNAFFELVTRIANRADLHEAIIAADEAEFVWDLLKQQGLL